MGMIMIILDLCRVIGVSLQQIVDPMGYHNINVFGFVHHGQGIVIIIVVIVILHVVDHVDLLLKSLWIVCF